MLRYIGNGDFIPGIPAMNLSADDVARYAGDFELNGKRGADALIASGLYELDKKVEPISKKKAEV